jgi:FtsP/CotA-like multicopper oxidase with cupredoxin domain
MTRVHAVLAAALVGLIPLSHQERPRPVVPAAAPAVSRVIANDNRRPAGVLRGGVLTLRLEARLGDWHPDGDSAPGATVAAFAEAGGAPRIPGPLVRVPAGTVIALNIRNSLTQPLTLHGLNDRLRVDAKRSDSTDALALGPGEARDMRFRLEAPGTYYYYGSTRKQTIDWRAGDDAQLTGVIVVDPPGRANPTDRIFLIGVWSDTAGKVLIPRTRILSVVNGRSWPNTERLAYDVGDTVHWRVINASADAHPMHLHGFYFDVHARGDGQADTTYDASHTRRGNTELLAPGTTMMVSWVPERAGNWLFHCHLPDHASARGPLGMPRSPSDNFTSMAGHQHQNHALSEMNGLILGIAVHDPRNRAALPSADTRPSRELRLVIRRNSGCTASQPFYEFALAKKGVKQLPDSGVHTGPPLVVTRGEPVRITVVNTLSVPTSVHWHGIELESYFDGVAGFSGAGARIAPIIAPNDSFVARFTPPRAGTFIYHTHVDEMVQQPAGLAGPLIVLEPGQTFDSTRDHVFLITTPSVWADELRSVLVNGSASPDSVTVVAGVPQRLRFINITLRRPGARLELWRDSTLISWRPLAKDGADLPSSFQAMRSARLNLSIGETMDFEIIPEATGNLRLEIRAAKGEPLAIVPFRVASKR